ncbi:MAG: VOC family protein [Actinomycetota bacterium]|nr:VOC family protein [Actinomycetota bacterium]
MEGSTDPIILGGFGNWAERPSIVLRPESVDAVGWLHRLFTGLAEVEGGYSVRLEDQSEVELEDVESLELRVSDFHPAMAVTTAGAKRFLWACNRDDWATVAALLEPFLAGMPGHRYLHHAFGASDEADVVLSFGEAISDQDLASAAELAADELAAAELAAAEQSTHAQAPIRIPSLGPHGGTAVPVSIEVARITIPASDVERARRFYEHVLGVEADDTVPSRLYFHTGGPTLVVVDWDVEGGDREFRPNPDDLYLATDGLEETFARAVAAGAEIRSPIDRGPWGERSFYCSDLDGNPLCFVDETTVFMGRGAPWE